MSENFLSKTGLRYYHDRIKTLFGSKTELQTVENKVEQLIEVGGEPNLIEVVKVNGTELPITEKAVDVIVPTTTSQLTNDSDFATTEYVELHGGKIDEIKVNGISQSIVEKVVNITVPTNVSDLTNDEGYQTESEVQALIDSELAEITGIDFQVVDTLPVEGVKGTIYLLPNETATSDLYDEYIWVTPTGQQAHWEQIGTTAVDLSDYWGKSELVAITTAEIDEIVA